MKILLALVLCLACYFFSQPQTSSTIKILISFQTKDLNSSTSFSVDYPSYSGTLSIESALALKSLNLCIQKNLLPRFESSFRKCDISISRTEDNGLLEDSFKIGPLDGNSYYYVIATGMLANSVSFSPFDLKLSFDLNVCKGENTLIKGQCVPSNIIPESPEGDGIFKISDAITPFLLKIPSMNSTHYVSSMRITINSDRITSFEIYAEYNNYVNISKKDLVWNFNNSKDIKILIEKPVSSMLYLLFSFKNTPFNGFPTLKISSDETWLSLQFVPILKSQVLDYLVPAIPIKYYRVDINPSLTVGLSSFLSFKYNEFNIGISVGSFPYINSLQELKSDWSACTTEDCEYSKRLFLNVSSPAIISVSKKNKTNQDQFILWSGSECPLCIHGICNKKTGKCDCINDRWISIDCSKWESKITPNVILIIIFLVIFMIIGIMFGVFLSLKSFIIRKYQNSSYIVVGNSYT